MIKKCINPFRYLPLRQALCWGIVAMILTTVFMWQYGLRATSLTQIDFGGSTLLNATLRQIAIWLMFSIVLYIGGVLFSKSKVRFGDVAAFNLFARIPFDISLLIFAIPSIRHIMGYATDGNLNAMMEHTGILLIVGVISSLFSIWYFYWTYKAFAEATNVKNGKGVALFFICYLITYVGGAYLLQLI